MGFGCGQYCALVPSMETIAEKTGNAKAKILAETLDAAIGKYLENGRMPSRKAGEIDNRGSSFYLAMYWAQALAEPIVCRVFVTSKSFTGNLGGVAGGDTICSSSASGSTAFGNLTRVGFSWKAWLADSTYSPANNFTRCDSYELLDGTLVASSFDTLISVLTSGNNLENAINLDETNATIISGVWTGTKYDGTSSGATCNNWSTSNASGRGTKGNTVDTNAFWAWGIETSCDGFNRLYCFEVILS